jgi:hypothetical protein
MQIELGGRGELKGQASDSFGLIVASNFIQTGTIKQFYSQSIFLVQFPKESRCEQNINTNLTE